MEPALIVHSRDRLSGTSDDFTIRCASLVEPGTYCVLYASLPVAVHNVREGINDSFTFQHNGENAQTVQLKAGFHTPTTLAHEFVHQTGLICTLGADFRQSEVFAADWLGPAASTRADFAMDEGRWAFTPVMKDARNFSNSKN